MPRQVNRRHLSVMCAPELAARVDAYADRAMISRSDAVRQLLHFALADLVLTGTRPTGSVVAVLPLDEPCEHGRNPATCGKCDDVASFPDFPPCTCRVDGWCAYCDGSSDTTDMTDVPGGL